MHEVHAFILEMIIIIPYNKKYSSIAVRNISIKRRNRLPFYIDKRRKSLPIYIGNN